jgi:flotillin
MDQAQQLGIALGLGVVGIFLLIAFVKANVVLCQPNELVVIAGRRRKVAKGEARGYRVMRGGRGFKLPLFESVARLSLNSQSVDLQVDRATCLGMIPVMIDVRATVKLAGSSADGMDEAIERFLGRGPDAVTKAAKQALEGALRGVIATMSPEDANANRLELAAQAAEKARADLRRLGIVLDFLQIQGIWDKQGYLEAIGRKQNAAVQRDARIAEARAEAESRQVAAEQARLGREAEIAAELEVVEKENSLAVKRADLSASASQAEQRASVAGDIARTEEQVTLEGKRAELAEKREQADTVVPARAKREAAMLEAEGRAARILEDGKAKAQAVENMRAQWEDGGTRDLFLIQMMPELLDKASRVVADNLRIDKLTVLDGGEGQGLPQHVGGLTKSAVVMLEQLANATGVDVAKLAGKKAGEAPPAVPKDLG